MYVCMLHAMTGAQNTTGLTTTNKPGLCPVCVCVCVFYGTDEAKGIYRPHLHSCPAPGQKKKKKKLLSKTVKLYAVLFLAKPHNIKMSGPRTSSMATGNCFGIG